MVNAVAAEVLKRIGDFNPQDMANTVGTFATAGIEDRTLVDAITVQARRRIHDFNSQGMANTVWAFATAGVEQG